MTVAFAPRRATWIDISAETGAAPLSPAESDTLDAYDRLYRSLCALLYNFVPTSGHPGGSVSSGRFVAALLLDAMDYDLADPEREDADLISYAAGHKAMGLYAMWALRDEVARASDAALLPSDARRRLRLEDLLGFRRNPITATPLFRRFGSKALDGHPTPATPFVRLSTGASGVGVASSIGLAFGARERYGDASPRVHVVEGEGGLTPGRVAEALAAAGTASLSNVVFHIDWNQASIDSDHVCRDDGGPGDYVQWDPRELFYLHDWNVIDVPEGHDWQQIVAAQRCALALDTGQPTAIVYHTHKGWKYGVTGKASHGAGHKLCSPGFYEALAELTAGAGDGQGGARPKLPGLPECEPGDQRCAGEDGDTVREECFWAALEIVRAWVEREGAWAEALAGRLRAARERLDARARQPRADAPDVTAVYETAAREAQVVPDDLRLAPGSTTTLRAALAHGLNHLNRASGGAVLGASADLLGSTSVSAVADGFPDGFWHATANPGARLLSTGGICEDAMAGILSGISAFGHNVGVGSSYGAFMAPLGHIAARLHAIGAQARASVTGDPYKPMVLICGHAGLKTGEDGPTHADPQALQLVQQDFPLGTAISLTPWEPQEVWTLTATALARRPAVVWAFVTRPNEPVLDRKALGLAPPEAAAAGLYVLRRPPAGREPDVVVVIQESAVTYAFVQEALPLLGRAGIETLAYSVASAELFDLLPEDERRRLFPEEHARRAMAITGFTLPTMFRWVHSEAGLAASLHPYRNGHYLGSGPGEVVLCEAGLDGEGQFRAIKAYAQARPRPAGA